jgi:DNA-binding MarR family transcriptional regulator
MARRELPLSTDAEQLLDVIERMFLFVIRLRTPLDPLDPEPRLAPTHREALGVVFAEGPLRLMTLAERLGVTRATASRVVDALVEVRLAERAASPDDGRGRLVELTPAGRSWHGERHARYAAAIATALDGLASADRARMQRLLAEVADLLPVRREEPAQPAGRPSG